MVKIYDHGNAVVPVIVTEHHRVRVDVLAVNQIFVPDDLKIAQPAGRPIAEPYLNVEWHKNIRDTRLPLKHAVGARRRGGTLTEPRVPDAKSFTG